MASVAPAAYEITASEYAHDRKRDRSLLVASLLQFALFVPFSWWAHRHPVAPFDVKISQKMQKNNSKFLKNAAITSSYLAGSPVILRIAIFPIGLLLWKMKLRLEAIMSIGVCMTAAIVKEALQRVINRPRPSPMLVQVVQASKGKSFPSGHVISSATFWGWFCILGVMHLKDKPKWYRLLLGIPVFLIASIGPARVYMGDHWASDVLAGYLFSGGLLCLFTRWYLRLQNK